MSCNTQRLCRPAAEYKHDLKKEEGTRTCEAAYVIPELSDREFYKNMLDANKQLQASANAV